jgi:hypothetical protein
MLESRSPSVVIGATTAAYCGSRKQSCGQLSNQKAAGTVCRFGASSKAIGSLPYGITAAKEEAITMVAELDRLQRDTRAARNGGAMQQHDRRQAIARAGLKFISANVETAARKVRREKRLARRVRRRRRGLLRIELLGTERAQLNGREHDLGRRDQGFLRGRGAAAN